MCEGGDTADTGAETGNNNVSEGAKAESKVGGKKSLLKPDGTPYAPWMNVAAGSDVRARAKKPGADPLQQLSSVGLKTKMLGDELELSWKTSDEATSIGFLIYRKAARVDSEEKEFKLIADANFAPAELSSKGPAGGAYSYLVPPKISQVPGSWIYKLSDIDSEGTISDIAQTLVEVEAAEDTKLRSIALAALLAVLGVALFLGLSLDPLAST